MGNQNMLSTLCYMEKDGAYLMLHRTVKKNDVNKDKWIGVGGHFEADESPEECLLREVHEETGYTLTSWRFRGIVTFVSGDGVTEYMHLFTADGFDGEPSPCDEGHLEWVEIEKVWNLNLWEGDKIFFRLIDEDVPFFSLKLEYDGKGGLVSAVLNGKPMELFDILNEDGTKTGLVRERGVAHREGSLHGTVHTWIVRKKPVPVPAVQNPRAGNAGTEGAPGEAAGDSEKGMPVSAPRPEDREALTGWEDNSAMPASAPRPKEQEALTGREDKRAMQPDREALTGWEILLQKRSAEKDSNPGCYDISSAGHLGRGDVPLEGALRELHEELGLTLTPGDLHFVGRHRGSYEAPFHGRLFRDNELSYVYVVTAPCRDEDLVLQKEEVESVLWMEYETCRAGILAGTIPNCIYADEFDMVGEYLRKLDSRH